MSTRLTLAVPALAGLLLAGCLEARNGYRQGQTDTVTSDTTVATDTTVADPCAGKVCDDGDPCTIDACDPASGLCTSTSTADKRAAAEPPECADDAGCDDGDACTRDVCYATGAACTDYVWAYCAHEPIIGCGWCTAETCDDGDACTEDACGPNDTCVHALIAGCGVGCSGVNAIAADAFEWTAWPGDPATLAGHAVPYSPAGPTCYYPFAGRAQDPCEMCEYPVGAAATLYSQPTVQLFAPAGWDGDPWACIESCGSTCTPVVWGAAYWVWGTARSSWMNGGAAQAPGAPAEPDVPVRPPADGLDVAGWCLQTNTVGLPGMYRGEVRVDGFEDLVFPFDVEIGVQQGELVITLAPSQCTAPECPTWIHEVMGTQTASLVAGDGTVSFDFEMLSHCSEPSPTTQVHVDLASYRSSLTGSFVDTGMLLGQQPPPDGDAAWCSRGTMVLTRTY